MLSAPKSTDDTSRFKQRLVGALVLIALAAIVIPLMLDFRKDYGHVIKGTNIPPKPDDFRVEVVPIKPPPELQDQQAEMTADEETQQESSSGPAATTAGPAVTTTKKVPAAEKPALRSHRPRPLRHQRRSNRKQPDRDRRRRKNRHGSYSWAVFPLRRMPGTCGEGYRQKVTSHLSTKCPSTASPSIVYASGRWRTRQRPRPSGTRWPSI